MFSSRTSTLDWNTRLVTGDAVTEITRLKADDGGPIDFGGATVAAADMRVGLIDEYVLATATRSNTCSHCSAPGRRTRRLDTLRRRARSNGSTKR